MSSNKGNKRFYAVSTGRTIGIYTSWGCAQRQVIHFHGGLAKRYSTLAEAKQDMRVNGYSDPPVFDHRDVTLPQNLVETAQVPENGPVDSNSIDIFSSPCPSSQTDGLPKLFSSDTDLTSIEVHETKELPNENTYVKQVLVLDHPELDMETLFSDSQKSSSETELLKLSQNPIFQTRANINMLDDIHQQINSRCPPLSGVEKTAKSDKSTQVETNAVSSTISGHTTSSCSSQTDNQMIDITSLNELLSKMDDKLNKLEDKVYQQCQINNELLNVVKHQHEQLSECQSLHQHQIDNLKKSIDNLDQSVKDCTLESQVLLHEKMEYFLNKMKTDSNDVDLNRNPSSPMPSSPQHNDNAKKHGADLQPHVIESFTETKLKQNNTALEPTNIHTETYTTQHGSGQTPSISSSNINSELHNNPENDEDVLHHHPTANRSQQYLRLDNDHDAIHQSQRYSLRLQNKSCRNVLLGDSNLKNVDKIRLDKTKATEIRTYRGASIKKLTEYVSSSQSYPEVKKVSLSVGSVDCSRRLVDAEYIIHDYSNLLSAVQKTFPSAQVGIVSIPPNGNPQACQYISKVNNALKKLAERGNHVFCHADALWLHVGNDGRTDSGFLERDKIHLTLRGLGLHLRPITSFFFGDRQRNLQINKSSRNDDVIEGQYSPGQRSSSESDSTRDHHDHHKSTSSMNQPDYSSHVKSFSVHIAEELSKSLISIVQKLIPESHSII